MEPETFAPTAAQREIRVLVPLASGWLLATPQGLRQLPPGVDRAAIDAL